MPAGILNGVVEALHFASCSNGIHPRYVAASLRVKIVEDELVTIQPECTRTLLPVVGAGLDREYWFGEPPGIEVVDLHGYGQARTGRTAGRVRACMAQHPAVLRDG